MHIYLVMTTISILLSYNGLKTLKNNKKKGYIYIICSGVPFLLVSCLRYNVGTDYMFRYVHDFKIFQNGGNVKNLEIGMRLLMKLIIFFNANYQWIFVITSILIISLIFFVIYRDSPMPWLSILLFFLIGHFFNSLNIVRQYVAISITLYGSIYLIKNNYKKWLLSIFIGCLFHTSSLISILLLIPKKLSENNKLLDIKLIPVFTIIIILFKDILRKLLIIFLSVTRFSVYFNSEFDISNFQIIPFTYNVILLFIFIYIIVNNKKEINDKKIYYYFNIQYILIIIVLCTNVIDIFSRIIYYFSIYQLISIPYFLSKIKHNFNFKIIIILMFAIILGYTNIFHNENEVVPYNSIFESKYNYIIKINNYEEEIK